MKKKGFTLVELLAVIAILAILVIIALPNVMNLFNRAKKNAFETEVKEIYKASQQKWMSDSMFVTEEKVYARCNGEFCDEELDLSGRKELEYYVKIDKSGNIVSLQATDHSYQYSYSGSGLQIDDIQDAQQVSKLNSNEIISISCAGVTGGSTQYKYAFTNYEMNVGQSVPSSVILYDTYQESTAVSGVNVFLRLKVVNNIITEAYVGGIVDGNLLYLRGGNDGSHYNSNKTIAINAFGSASCSESNYSTQYSISCNKNNMSSYMYTGYPSSSHGGGRVGISYYDAVYDDDYWCFVYNDGYTSCSIQNGQS